MNSEESQINETGDLMAPGASDEANMAPEAPPSLAPLSLETPEATATGGSEDMVATTREEEQPGAVPPLSLAALQSEMPPVEAATEAPEDMAATASSDFPEAAPSQEALQDTAAQKLDEASELAKFIAELRQERTALQQEIVQMQATRSRLLQEQLGEMQSVMGRLVQESLGELEKRKQTLQIAVEQLERRQERIRNEMRTSFAGVSQDLAIKVQGFKEYLVGSLQDLVSSVEELELAPKPQAAEPPPMQEQKGRGAPDSPQFSEPGFQKTVKQIRRLLDQYRNQPDYYGAPWQLRRTFEPIHAERVADWFFTQGGRGALRTMGSRLQNILIASAVISVLYKLYGRRVRPLILANSPERLGEWRRGLQDCLGISRGDFGPERGVVLFEEAAPLAQKADRLVKEGMLPLIVVDETEEKVSLSLLQFPLWLAFAPEPVGGPMF
nr:DUF3086 domain-containing protein [[Phormidium] sp. ETS-05]